MADRFPIRRATAADLAGLAQLEEASFSDPWSSEMIAEALAAAGTVALLATDDDGRVIGSVLGREAAGEAEILTLAVDPGLRGHGLGRRLLAVVLDELAADGASTVWLEVRPSNLAARRMYQAAGFVATGMRRGYYRRPTEDALILSLQLASRGAGEG